MDRNPNDVEQPPQRRKVADRGGDLAHQAGDDRPVSDVAGSKVTFDVTSLVKAAVAGQLGSSRYTRIVLVDLDAPTNESWRVVLHADESNTALRPTLKVTYGGPTTAAATAAAASGSGGSTLRVLEYNVAPRRHRHRRQVRAATASVDWIVEDQPGHRLALRDRKKDRLRSAATASRCISRCSSRRPGRRGTRWTSRITATGPPAGIRNAIISKYPVHRDLPP